MTLVVSITTRESIWMMADRRLSWNDRPPKDDATKLMFLETTDGCAILGYAGLGATGSGTEPSAWMSKVLRGRNLPLEVSLAVLADAALTALPQHLAELHGSPVHHILAPAFLNDEARIYSIDLELTRDREQVNAFQCARHVRKVPAGRLIHRHCMTAGSGAEYLEPKRNATWVRDTLETIRRMDRKQVPPEAVAAKFAAINADVSKRDSEGKRYSTVGESCIVAWRFRKNGIHGGGGGHQAFNRTAEAASTGLVPTIARGGDIAALANVFSQQCRVAIARQGNVVLSDDDLKIVDDAVAKLPNAPDERLR
jgi:hypothetical protein